MENESPTAESPGGVPAIGGGTRARMRALVARVGETCDLPTLPAVAARALVLARDPDARADELAHLVLSDGPLAARVLKISRSVLYARYQPPRTVCEAITTVGFVALRKILIAASARSAYRADDAVAQGLWEHALATALAADELAVLGREARGGDSFIAGLLHDIGRLVFHLADAVAYTRVMSAGEAAEEAAFGVTHAAVGACLAEQWGLEEHVAEAILLHHAEDAPALGLRLAIADRIAQDIGFGSGATAEERVYRVAPLATEPAGPVAAADPAAGEQAAVAERVAASFEAERGLFD
jgi:putative nucleotidyltransferase with HDIG domain